jgi:ComEC/Rec2-related protein
LRCFRAFEIFRHARSRRNLKDCGYRFRSLPAARFSAANSNKISKIAVVQGRVGIFVRKRPFLPVAALFALGIVGGRNFSFELFKCVVAFCIGLLFLLARPSRVFAAAFLCFVAGAGFYAARYEIWSENDLRLILPDQPVLATVHGRLIDTPALRDFYSGTNVAEYSYAQLKLSEILINKEWRPAVGVLAASMRGTLGPDFFKGRSVEVAGVISMPKRAPAEGLFDYREYLFNSRVFYQLRTEGTNDWRLLSFEPLPLTERFLRWAQAQLHKGIPFEDEALQMLWTMTLGWKQNFSGEAADAFIKTGTMHIFAISGLHVACIAGSLLAVLRAFGLSRDRASAVLIPLIWFYTLATGWQSSAIRSALMSSFIFAGWTLRRPAEVINSTAAAALLILFFQPEQLFQTSFQLSFAVVLALGFLMGELDRQAPELLGRIHALVLRYDPLLPEQLRPGWKRLLEMPVTFVYGNLLVALAAYVGSFPVTAYYFNMVSPISLVANLVAVPLSSLALASALGSLLLPPLAPVFNFASWAFMWETVGFTRWLAHLNLGFFYVPKPGLLLFILYFTALIILVLPQARKGRMKFISVGTLICIAVAWCASFLSTIGDTKITVLPSAGMPIHVDAPGRALDLLIDCSNEREAGYTLKRFLHGQGIGTLPAVLITHADLLHAGGLMLLDAEFSPGKIFRSHVPVRSAVFRRMDKFLKATPKKDHRISAGENAGGWTVLNPERERRYTRGADSAVALTTGFEGWRVLLLSDLSLEGIRGLLERTAGLRADVVITSGGFTEKEMAEIGDKTGAKLLILGNARQPMWPARARSPMSARSSPRRPACVVLRTAEEGSITLRFHDGECIITTAEEHRFTFPRK